MKKAKENKNKVLTPEIEAILFEVYNTLIDDGNYGTDEDCKDVIESALSRAGYYYEVEVSKLNFRRTE